MLGLNQPIHIYLAVSVFKAGKLSGQNRESKRSTSSDQKKYTVEIVHRVAFGETFFVIILIYTVQSWGNGGVEGQ